MAEHALFHVSRGAHRALPLAAPRRSAVAGGDILHDIYEADALRSGAWPGRAPELAARSARGNAAML